MLDEIARIRDPLSRVLALGKLWDQAVQRGRVPPGYLREIQVLSAQAWDEVRRFRAQQRAQRRTEKTGRWK